MDVPDRPLYPPEPKYKEDFGDEADRRYDEWREDQYEQPAA